MGFPFSICCGGGRTFIVAGAVVGCFERDICTDADTQAIKETMQGLATKSFALYAAEKGIKSNSKKEEE